MLEELFIKSRDFINLNNQEYKRYFINSNKLEHRLSIIIGPRGIGKTTTIAQYIAYIGVFGQQCRSSTGHFYNEIF